MSRTVIKYGVFIASPGDVAAERDVVESAIEEWNNLNSVKCGAEMETLRWDKGHNVLPNIEADGQETINREILSRADVLISIFWSKVGAGGTMTELRTFKKTKLAYFCTRDVPRNLLDADQIRAVMDLEKEWKGNGAFIQSFNEAEELREVVLKHLDRWMQDRLAPDDGESTVRPAEGTLLAKPDEFQTILTQWSQNKEPGTVFLFNTELYTFSSADEFYETWSVVAKKECNIKRVVLVLPPHKKRRLIRYLSAYKEEFERFEGNTKFEVADFPDSERMPSSSVAFAAFRLENRPLRRWHNTCPVFVLAEPFATRSTAAEIDGFCWESDVMLVSVEGDPLRADLKKLATQYFPKDKTQSVLKLFSPTARVIKAPRNIVLPGNRNRPAAMELRLKIREDLFSSNVPTYVLDENYFIIDWNAAFDLVFGGCEFYRGQYVTNFLNTLANSREVISRGKDFTQPPLFDDEMFVFLSKEFGEMRFLKTTAQALNERGEYHGWNVALSLSSVEHADLYRKRLRAVVEYETLTGRYAPAYDRLTGIFTEYQKLAVAMADAVGDASSVLDLGSGPGHLARILARRGKNIVAVDSNDEMLACAYVNCVDEISGNLIEVHKANLESITKAELADIRSNGFAPPYDAVVMLNVLYAIRNKARLLAFVRDVLKPGGTFVISGPRDNVNIYPLYASLQNELPDEMKNDFQIFKDVNDRMLREGLLTQSVAETHELLTKAGFEILEPGAPVFCNEGIMIVARTPVLQGAAQQKSSATGSVAS